MRGKQFIMCLLGVILIGLVGCATVEQEKEEVRIIPMKDFFRNPEKAGFELSPNGEYLAFLMPWESRLNVHVQKVGEEAVTRITDDTERDIIGFAWANNNRVVYIQDKAGNENWHGYAVDIDDSNYVELTPFDGVRAQLVDILRDNDEEMLISLNKRDPRIFDVYRINVNSGEMEMIAENPGNVSQWVTDNEGKLRIAVTADGVNQSLLYRKTEGDPFETVVTTDFSETLQPLNFTFDDQYLYVASNIDRDKTAIFKYDLEKAEHLDLIYEHADVDVARLLRSRHRKIITGVSFYTDKRGFHFFDEWRGNLQATLESKLPGYEVAVASMSRDESKVLVRTYSDKSLGAYYYYETDGGELQKLVEVSPWMNEGEMADMKPVSYNARDGLKIPGYLTLPKDVEPKALPTVLLVHGGPWARDYWGFNPEVQFLANRGYAVLQINFRGSTGYGKGFWKSSFKQWGKTMQDDITDGAEWLIEQGIADAQKIGIYGGSYGGYATLAGVAFTPDLYACGVDYVGVSNLFTFLESIPPYWEPYRQMMYEMIGNPEADKELMEAVSPFFHADKIKVPMLIAQGANDPRVKQAESDMIVEALKGRGIDVDYMVKENEGHGFMLEENRFDFYGAMEKFLGKHLGGRVEAEAATM